MLVLGIAVAILGAFALVYLVFFMVAPDRAKDFAATVSMWARSLARSKAEAKGRTHRRRTDPPGEPAREHRRNTPRPSMLVTIREAFRPPTPRDSGEKRRTDTDQ